MSSLGESNALGPGPVYVAGLDGVLAQELAQQDGPVIKVQGVQLVNDLI